MSRTPDWRPRFHFTAPSGWINDPNGLVCLGGVWHLHYQFEWPRCWGHAVSRDLIHWDQWPVALRPDDLGDCWSGATVQDARNTSGFFAGSAGGLVSVYTSQDSTRGQRLSLASSADGGVTWRKFSGNPVLSRGQPACRDPKVWWDETRARWTMVLTENHHLTFFASSNLRDWSETGRFTPRAEPGVDGLECPDLFALPVENRPGETNWVLSASYLSGENFAEGGGFGVCAQRYWVGNFDGKTFHAENGAEKITPLSRGPDEYAAIVWPRETSGARRTLMIAWMNHWGYAKQIPTTPWQGCLTFPREVTLVEGAPGEWRLRQLPARELWALPHAHREFPPGGRSTEEPVFPLGRFQSGAIKAVLRLSRDASLRFDLFSNKDVETSVGFDAARQTIWFDRRNSGSPVFHPRFPLREETSLSPDETGRLELLIVIDRSTIEVFGGGGAVVLSGLSFPPAGAEQVNLRLLAGSMQVESLETWNFEAEATSANA